MSGAKLGATPGWAIPVAMVGGSVLTTESSCTRDSAGEDLVAQRFCLAGLG